MKRLFALPPFIALMVLTALMAFAYASEKNKILAIQTKRIGTYAEIQVATSQRAKPEVIVLDSPNRIALVFGNSTIASPVTIPGNSPLIKMVQAMQFDADTVYVMIEPKEELTYEFTSLIGKNRVILEVTKARPGSARKVAPSPQQTLEALEVISSEVVVPAEEKEEEIGITVEAVTAPPAKPVTPPIPPAKPELPLKGMTIVIDPGHGGRDPGYVGHSGVLEKDLTYRVALRLRTHLNNAGAKVIFTRNGDTEIKNRGIVNVANSNNADLFVAVHFNSYTSPNIRGCETYYYTQISRTFARVMQTALSRTTRSKDRGIKKVTYYIVHHARMPAILVEAGYLTNPNEEKLILTPQYREIIAAGICKGIKEYAKMSKLWPRSRT